MTIRERWVRFVGAFWSDALLMGAFWSLGMIGFEYVTSPAGGPSVTSVVGTLFAGTFFGLAMAFVFKRMRQKPGQRETGSSLGGEP